EKRALLWLYNKSPGISTGIYLWLSDKGQRGF
ncbi:unnamed protein product, partial [marine sediment metagenome]